MKIDRINYQELDEPVGPYVHAVKHNGVLYLSGLTAFGTPAHDGNCGDQARAIFDQIEKIAQAEGGDLSHILKVTVFVTSLDEIDSLREVLFEKYGAHLPASALVQVQALFAPQLKVEIEAMLAVN